MVNRLLKIIWDIEARNNFYNAIVYIKEESPQNGEKVKRAIISKVNELKTNPEKHPPDKYRENNKGNFRAFEIYHCRISYYISKSEIRIVRFRHTSMEPLNY